MQDNDHTQARRDRLHRALEAPKALLGLCVPVVLLPSSTVFGFQTGGGMGSPVIATLYAVLFTLLTLMAFGWMVPHFARKFLAGLPGQVTAEEVVAVYEDIPRMIAAEMHRQGISDPEEVKIWPSYITPEAIILTRKLIRITTNVRTRDGTDIAETPAIKAWLAARLKALPPLSFRFRHKGDPVDRTMQTASGWGLYTFRLSEVSAHDLMAARRALDATR